MVIHAPFDLSLNEQFNLLPVGLYQIIFNDDSDLSFHMRSSELTYTNSFYAGQTVNLQGRLIDYIILETGSGYILPGMQILAPYQASIQEMNINSLPGLVIDTWNAGNLNIGSITTLPSLVIGTWNAGKLDIGSIDSITSIPDLTVGAWNAGSIDIGTVNSLTAGNITVIGNSRDLLTPQYNTGFSLPAGYETVLDIIPASGKEIYIEAIIVMVAYQAGTSTTGQIYVQLMDTYASAAYTYSVYITNPLTLTYPGSQELVLGILPNAPGFSAGGNFYWSGRASNDQQTYAQIVPFRINGTNKLRILVKNTGSGDISSGNAYVLLRGKVIPL